MSRTPAAQLARLKLTYPLWQFERVDELAGTIYVAIKGRRRIADPSLAGLENKLIRATGMWDR